MPYSAQGTLTGVGSVFFVFRHGGGGEIVVLDREQALNRSGSLAPGDYEISLGSSCSDDSPGSCSASYSGTLVIGG